MSNYFEDSKICEGSLYEILFKCTGVVEDSSYFKPF